MGSWPCPQPTHFLNRAWDTGYGGDFCLVLDRSLLLLDGLPFGGYGLHLPGQRVILAWRPTLASEPLLLALPRGDHEEVTVG